MPNDPLIAKRPGLRKEVLFLCTGNYYRSRFAEVYFNTLASQSGLRWRAVSRGIATELGVNNAGPISPLALARLARRGMNGAADMRAPLQLRETDLAAAALVVALDSSEHPALMRQRFAAWADRIVYWDVPDLDRLDAEGALSRIEDNVAALVQQLCTAYAGGCQRCGTDVPST
jgi:protein-tyrosine phosphatase